MKAIIFPAVSLLALAVPAAAAANDASADADSEQTIIVTGRVDGYRTIDTTSGTKTSTPILDVPQAISVATAQQIGDQAIRSMADLVRLFPGISAGQGEGQRDQITLRGNNSTADFFVDGLRDDVQYFRSFYNIERVEAHKGPNAMIFGRGGGGGIINRVTKAPVLDDNMVAGTASLDSFGSWFANADLNYSIADRAALRVNGFYEALRNHRDIYAGDRYAVNPVGGLVVGSTRLQLGYEYVNDYRVVDRGIPSETGRPLAGFRDTFFGVSGLNETGFEAHVVSFRSETDLAPNLKLSTQALYGDYDKYYRNAFPATAVSRGPAGATLGVEAYEDRLTRRTGIVQGNLEWKVDTGAISHIILIGGEYSDQDSGNERINGFFSPTAFSAANRRTTIALADPVRFPAITFVSGPTGNSNRSVTSRLAQSSAYVQDQISFGETVDLIAGLRYDRFDLGVTNQFTAAVVDRVDHLWSPRAGLVFKPIPAASIYVSYARSFLPQAGDQFVAFDPSFATLAPERFDNYEVGAKWDILPDLSLTAALYRLDRSNTRAAGPTAGTIVLTGEQRSQGLELGLTGRITPRWQTAIGYALTEAEITATTTAAPAGRQVAQVPRHQLSLWNRYDVSDRLGLGLGVYHQAGQFTTISNAVRLPAYTRIDAAVFFKVTRQIEAQINVENLTNTAYFPTAHNDNNISTGAPINARATINVRF